MKLKIGIGLCGCPTVCSLGSAGSETKKGKSENIPAGRLIRIDLLAAKTEELSSPQRDIFSPRPIFDAVSSVSNDGVPEVVPSGAPETATADSAGQSSFNLSYIGYIHSARKIIALVILEGQAMAVAEGEEILPGFKVEKVQSSSLDVIGPDAKTSSFPLQGEQP